MCQNEERPKLYWIPIKVYIYVKLYKYEMNESFPEFHGNHSDTHTHTHISKAISVKKSILITNIYKNPKYPNLQDLGAGHLSRHLLIHKSKVLDLH